MPTKLKVLILEDSAADAELALHELRRAGYEPDWKRVEAEPDFVAQLDQAWDVILVDYNLPEYDGQRALEITRERGLDIPLIIVSGTIGEEKAVATMKAGANDYIMKDRLSRLGPAVERELCDAIERRERKRAEEALRASEERFRQLSELLPQIVFETDIKGTLTFANQYGLKSFGYSREDFQSGINIIALVAPEDRETIKSRLKEILSGSETTPREFQVVKKDGGKFPILMHANAIIGEGVPIGLRGIAIDITERKRAEEALRESEAGYRVLFEETKQGILVADAQTQRFKYANQSMSRMLGYTIEELLKLGVADIHPKESLPRVQSEFEAQIQKEKTLVTDLPCLRKDGTVIHADINSSPIIINGRQRNVAFFTDVTERKRAEEALHESEEKYRALVENASEAILIAQDGMLKFVNHMASKISGYSDLELRSSPFLEFVYPEDRDMVGERYLERFKGDMFLPRYAFRLVSKDGGIKWVEINAVLVDWEGKPATLNFLSDITERKRAEEELRKSEERFKFIFEYAPDAYYVNDLKGNFIDGNKAAEKATGYKREELIGSSFLKLGLLSLDQLPRAAKLLVYNAMGKQTGPDEFILKKKSGDKVAVEISTYPAKFNGKLEVLGIARDITERVRSEEGRRQAEENFRRSMDESPLGIRIVSAEGETLYANRTILDIYGFDDIEELKSTPVKSRCTPESYAEYQLRKEKRMNGEDSPSEYELNIIKKTGEIRHLQVFRKDILWDGQKQSQMIYRDITDRTRAEEKIRETVGSLRNALGGIIQVLSSITEKRDPYTSGHQKRVADLARAIGQEMGLDAERVEGLRLAGTIHDVGKVSIPAEILSKPGPLTKIEFEMIKSHPQVGHDIIQDIDFTQPIAEMILQHHERMNGSGYPNRLKGKKILLEARILAVSDVVEAMASHRPYRSALGTEVALEEIEKNKGILYDPDVVSACLTLFRKKGFKLK